MSSARSLSKVALLSAALGLIAGNGSLRARADAPLSDPTQPPAAARIAADEPEAVDHGQPSLHGIFHASDHRFAVVDGRRVEVGDRVAGARVVAIEIDRVRLRRDGALIEIELVASAFKNARRSRPATPADPSPPQRPDSTHPASIARGAVR